jgi:SAM-dependent methyltransferase
MAGVSKSVYRQHSLRIGRDDMTDALDWTGAVGDVWAAEWRRTDRSFADLSRHLDAAILAAAPADPFRALDIGCGAGGTSLALANSRPDATIVGVDLSAGLVEVAQARTPRPVVLRRRQESRAPRDALGDSGFPPSREHGRGGERITFHAGDAVATAQAHGPFDLFYSRHGVMFFDDPVAAFAGLHAAASADAALLFSCFADWSANAFASDIAGAIGGAPAATGTPGPFAFADPNHVATVLAAAGWRDAAPVRVPFAYRADEGVDAVGDALSFFQRIGPAAARLRAAPPGERSRLLDRLAAVIRDRQVGNAIDFPALAWIWSAKAGPAAHVRGR